jgi:hypothetical protein
MVLFFVTELFWKLIPSTERCPSRLDLNRSNVSGCKMPEGRPWPVFGLLHHSPRCRVFVVSLERDHGGSRDPTLATETKTSPGWGTQA